MDNEKSEYVYTEIATKIYKAFVEMLGYQGYEQVIPDMLSKKEDKYGRILWDEENCFPEEVWSMFVLMFGDYGTSPRFGWIEKVAEFKSFLQKIYSELTKNNSKEKE